MGPASAAGLLTDAGTGSTFATGSTPLLTSFHSANQHPRNSLPPLLKCQIVFVPCALAFQRSGFCLLVLILIVFLNLACTLNPVSACSLCFFCLPSFCYLEPAFCYYTYLLVCGLGSTDLNSDIQVHSSFGPSYQKTLSLRFFSLEGNHFSSGHISPLMSLSLPSAQSKKKN